MAEEVHCDKKDEEYLKKQVFFDPIHGSTSIYPLVLFYSKFSKIRANNRLAVLEHNQAVVTRQIQQGCHFGATGNYCVVFDTALVTFK